MRKFLSWLVLLAMILSMSVPALAANPITSTEDGNNSDSQNVTANYTPSYEAIWGTDADHLTQKGTLAEAMVAAAGDSSIGYVRIAKNLSFEDCISITGGNFTLDISGKTVTISGDTGFDVYDATVVFKDSATGGKVKAFRQALYIVGSTVTIEGGTYESDGESAVCISSNEEETTSNVTIKGGTFRVSGENSYAIDQHAGTLTIKGGTFETGTIYWYDGTLDLSGYQGTMPLTEWTVSVASELTGQCNVGTDIQLPAGYGFYSSSDAEKNVLTELNSGDYGIVSTGTSSAKVTVTGVKITIGDTTYTKDNTSATNPAKITPDSTVTITVIGTNLDNLTDDDLLKTSSMVAQALNGFTKRTTNDAKTELTAQLDKGDIASLFGGATEAWQIAYTDKGWSAREDDLTGLGVYVIYDDGTNGAKATITGVTVKVGEMTYESGTVTVTPTSGDVTIILSGENLDKLSSQQNVINYSGSVSEPITIIDWRFDSTTNTATKTVSAATFSALSTATEIKYSNDNMATWVNSGVYVIYDDGTNGAKATITGVTVKVGETTYESGNVVLTQTSGEVTIILSGEYFSELDGHVNYVYYNGSYGEGIETGTGWVIDTSANTATKTVSAATFSAFSTATEIKYRNEGSATLTGSGIYIVYQSSTTSVDITWGAMSFTYSDEQVDGADKGWTCESGANKVTVENSGSTTIKAQIAYQSATGYTEISGAFDLAEKTLNAGESQAFILTLSNKPSQALDGETIGSITVTITKVTTPATDTGE